MKWWLALCLALAASAAHPATAIVHAHAYTMTGAGAVEDATLVMDGGHIVSVAAHGPAPAGAHVVDAGGKVVTPGLISAATQLGLAEVALAADTDDRAVSSGPLSAAFDVSYAFNANSVLLPVARADGLTRAVIYPGLGQGPFAGQGALIRLTPPGGTVERPRAAAFVVTGQAAMSKVGGSRAAAWGLIRNALAEARRLEAGKLDPRERLNSLPDLEALRPVVAGAIPLVVQADRASDIRQAIDLARDEKVKVVILGGAEAWSLAGELTAAKIPVVLDPQADMPQTFDQIGARYDNAALLAKAGVPVAFEVSGNGVYLSYDVGEAIRWGAGMAVANGLPYVDALAAITRGPATIFGFPGGAGTLAAGADADVVIWDGDPLEPASAPAAVFVGGEDAPLVTRQTMLRDRYAPRR
jgi:imidazolonepropionase-like amidohydrolase